jgi:hypothetical protein
VTNARQQVDPDAKVADAGDPALAFVTLFYGAVDCVAKRQSVVKDNIHDTTFQQACFALS